MLANLALDVDAVCQCGCGSKGPAAATVLRDVLVAGHGQVCRAVHIAPAAQTEARGSVQEKLIAEGGGPFRQSQLAAGT
jgi:hypothetical protein